MPPQCPACNREYSVFENAPYILPCCHTFCWRCVSHINRLAKQRSARHGSAGGIFNRLCRNPHGRRCPICWKSFNTYQLNLASLDFILQLKLLSSELASCNECLKRVPCDHLRRCHTCEREVRQRVNFPRVSCVICLECALDTHQGHELTRENRHTELYQNETALSRRHRSISPNSRPPFRIKMTALPVTNMRPRSISLDPSGRQRKRRIPGEGRTGTAVADCMGAALRAMRVKSEKIASLVNDITSCCLREVRRGWKRPNDPPLASFHNDISATRDGGNDEGGFDTPPSRPPPASLGSHKDVTSHSRVVHKYENVAIGECERWRRDVVEVGRAPYTYVCFDD